MTLPDTRSFFRSLQESMKVREVIPHIGPIPIVIPLKLLSDLLRDPGFPRGLTDSQSYVPIFANESLRGNSLSCQHS